MAHLKTLSPFILFSLLTIPVVSPADTPAPELSPTLGLSLPFIRYQSPDNGEQFIWADLQYTASEDGRLLFEVKNFGFLEASAEMQLPRLKSIDEISADGPPQIIQTGKNEAQLLFTSSIPLACSVVYGTSTDFGSISVDQDMNGGAHNDHSPYLINLQADTVYYYRVQGTSTEGIVYWGETESFKTAPEDNNQPVNLISISSGANISSVSSNFGNASNSQTWGANNAIDDSSASAWSSHGDGDNAYIEISLAQSSQINQIGVWSRSMPDGSAKIFTFTISIDDGTVLGPFTLPDTSKIHTFDVKIQTSSLRLDVVSSSGGNTGLIEFAAY